MNPAFGMQEYGNSTKNDFVADMAAFVLAGRL